MPIDAFAERREILKSENYKVYVSVIGHGDIDIYPEKDTYEDDEEITLVVSPGKSWNTARWHNVNKFSDNEATVILEDCEDIDDVAVELHPEFEVNVSGRGDYNIELKEDVNLPGEYLILSADSGDGYYFKKWSDEVEDQEAETTAVQVYEFDDTGSRGGASTLSGYPTDNLGHYRENRGVTVNFERTKYYIETDTEGMGHINKSPYEEYYTYDYGEVLLSALPEDGWGFVEFSGDIENFEQNGSELVFDFDEPFDKETYTYNVNAKFNPGLTVNAERIDDYEDGDIPDELEINTDPDIDYPEYGEEVSLSVDLPDHWEFSYWSDNVKEVEEKETSVVMDGPQEVTCFVEGPEGYELEVDIAGDGDVLLSPSKEKYFMGETVTLTAVPQTNWEFSHWGMNDREDDKIEITIDSMDDLYVEAIFGPTLYVATDGVGEATIDPDKNYYQPGEAVNISIKPQEGYKFVEWVGAVEDKDSKSTTVYMDDYKNVTAILEPPQYELDVSIIEGEGDVELIPEKDAYGQNEEVTIRIDPKDRYDTIEWYGDIENRDELINTFETTVEVTEDKDIEVELERSFYLNIEVSGIGETDPPEGSHKYSEGSEIIIDALPGEHPFVMWRGDVDKDEYDQEQITLIMDEDKNIEAIFDSNSLGFFNIDPDDEFDISPGQTIEIDVSAYFRWGDNDNIEYMVENLPANAEFDRENLVIRWTPIDESKLNR